MKATSKMTADTNNSAMESLTLPPDLYWDGKTEPISPLPIELFSMTEPAGFWLNDDIENGIILVSDDDFELKPGMELLNGDDFVFEFSDLKEEWPDNKLPLLDVDSTIAHPNPVTKVHNSFDIDTLKSENFEVAVLTTLTPPQSPPQTSTTAATISLNAVPTEHVVNFNNIAQHQLLPISPATVSEVLTPHTGPSPAVTPEPPSAPALHSHSSHFAPYYPEAPFTPSEAAQTDDDKRNSQIVDEFLKSCIQELPNLNDECESMSWSSYSTASRPESVETDEDWSPDSSFSSSASSSPIYNGDDDNSQSVLSKSAEPKKRTRPYGRGIEDRKIRKKEQNKNAATRYRQKKKVEMENVLNEEQQLTQRNEELKRVLAERQREAKYLKTLIKEFYKKKKGTK
ncbi:cyclic AMP-dependent transcription factor ATF-4 [Anastrepha obliqua]|uniref:cyclic AMP-dependent transcription factor ATF-4 n=1 Tax=Anastrepha obliqua TaxID=95512 RepID=UPI0024090DEB|nr:cyclic AMP-dependent transcription factor ATF-4 [Anastrepha obliqua]